MPNDRDVTLSSFLNQLVVAAYGIVRVLVLVTGCHRRRPTVRP